MSAQPDHNDIEKLMSSTKLNGRTIKEWKEDCETFYLEKLDAEKLKDKLESEIIRLEIHFLKPRKLSGILSREEFQESKFDWNRLVACMEFVTQCPNGRDCAHAPYIALFATKI